MSHDALELLGSVLKVVLPMLGGGGLWKVGTIVRDLVRDKRNQPAVETSSALEITRELRELAAEAVAGVRAEMAEQKNRHAEERAEDRRLLAEAKVQLREMAERMEAREREHVENERRSQTLMARMKSRIAQLADVLTANNLEVPPEVYLPAGSRP